MRLPCCGCGGKRGEAAPEDLSGNVIVQLGLVTEDLNRHWYETNTGQLIMDVQKRAPGADATAERSGRPGDI
jgi:hypothetical protein